MSVGVDVEYISLKKLVFVLPQFAQFDEAKEVYSALKLPLTDLRDVIMILLLFPKRVGNLTQNVLLTFFSLSVL